MYLLSTRYFKLDKFETLKFRKVNGGSTQKDSNRTRKAKKCCLKILKFISGKGLKFQIKRTINDAD